MKIYELDIDFSNYTSNRKTLLQNIYYNEQDVNTAYINARLLNKGSVLDLNQYDRIVVSIRKNDDSKVVNDCVVLNTEKGIIQIPFSIQSLKAIGVNNFQIMLVGSNGQMVSPKFYYNVDESLVGNDDIESSSEYPILTMLISQTEELVRVVDALRIDITNLNEELQSNEEIRQSQEVIRESNEEIRKSQEVIRENNEEIRQSQESDREDSIIQMQIDADNKISDVNAKIAETDEKIIETTNITNENTKKIDDKVVDIQNQLDTRVTTKFIEVDATLDKRVVDKFIEVDTTLDTRVTAKFTEVDNVIGDKVVDIQNQLDTRVTTKFIEVDAKIVEVDTTKNNLVSDVNSAKNEMILKVDNKIIDADNKIVDCESRMGEIEDTFDNLVTGTGFATELYVNKKIGDVTGNVPENLNNLQKIASAIGDDENFSSNVLSSLESKADKSNTYTKAEVDVKIDNVIGGGTGSNVAYGTTVSTSDWILDSVDNMYYVDVAHELGTKRFVPTIIDNDTNDSVETAYRIVDDNTVRFFNELAINATITIINGNATTEIAYAKIDDVNTTTGRTWSSSKIKEELDKKSTDAKGTSYDNATSGLASDNVQSAIDELASEINGQRVKLIDSVNKIVVLKC